MWYGLRVGLTRDEVLDTIFGDLLDLIAIEQIKVEGAKPARPKKTEYDEFMDILAKE